MSDLSPIEQYQANQRDYEEERFARLMREIKPKEAAPFCSTRETAGDDNGDVSVERVVFGFVMLVLIALVGVGLETGTVQSVLRFFGLQP